ncbi:MAG TPA: hypothetical protein PLI45_01335 [Candidatus Woesebacteria bacterium]|nr:hypothetical protein [Candidatus Woesebacteria bacterium]
MESALKNVLGKNNREEIIVLELKKAGITVAAKEKGSFPTYGKLGNFCFYRGPWYWLAVGDVPLDVAKVLYADSQHRSHLSVAGFNSKARPDDLRSYSQHKRRSANTDKYIWAKPQTLPGGSIDYFIPYYGITSLEALVFFAETLKKHQLI